MSLIVLDPTATGSQKIHKSAGRLKSIQALNGAMVGIISNGKQGSEGLFAHLEQLLQETYEVDKVVLLRKSNYSAPAAAEIIDAAKEWTLAITGPGD